MKCDFCGGDTRNKQVKRQHWLDKQLYIVENVSAEVCMECGERYFHAKTLDAIDKFLSEEHEVKAQFNVELVQLQRGSNLYP